MDNDYFNIGAKHNVGEDLIRHGFAVPPSPTGEGFWVSSPTSLAFPYALKDLLRFGEGAPGGGG